MKTIGAASLQFLRNLEVERSARTFEQAVVNGIRTARA